MKQYTVVYFGLDDLVPRTAQVEAEDAYKAEAAAVKGTRYEKDTAWQVAAVYEGHHINLYHY
jgi:hypothetical protein